jgi:hypothetical protein
MKLDLPMLLLYAAIIGVGVWIYGLVTGNGPDAGNGTGNGTDTGTTTLNGNGDDEHYGGASTGFGGLVNWVQDATNSDGMGSAAIDFLQERWS